MVLPEFVTLIDEVFYASVRAGRRFALIPFDQRAQPKDFRTVVAEVACQGRFEGIGDIVDRRSDWPAKCDHQLTGMGIPDLLNSFHWLFNCGWARDGIYLIHKILQQSNDPRLPFRCN